MMPSTSELISQVGEMMCVGFYGTTPSADITTLLREFQVGGIILFRRNITGARQVGELTQALQSLRMGELPLLMSVDQEGGPVARLRGICTDFPPMAALGASGDVGLAHAYGACLAEELTALGFNLDYAPVVDVHSRPENPVIGVRAFGQDPNLVGRMAVAQIHGMMAGGLLPCAKHFPGHGDTTTDSHRELPVVPHDLARLRQVELPPFVAAIKAGVPSIMTAHVTFPAVDTAPATLSAPILQGLLRQDLGFEGVIISDDLEMNAVAEDPGVVEAALRGLYAGVDLFLVCHQMERQVAVWESLRAEAERSSRARELIQAAASRVRRMKALLDPVQDLALDELPQILRSPLARALAADIARRGSYDPTTLTPLAPELREA